MSRSLAFSAPDGQLGQGKERDPITEQPSLLFTQKSNRKTFTGNGTEDRESESAVYGRRPTGQGGHREVGRRAEKALKMRRIYIGSGCQMDLSGTQG